MKKIFSLVFSLFVLISITPAQVKVQNLLIENLSNPIGLDIKQPRFTWQLVSDKRNIMQSAYEIRVTPVVNGKVTTCNSGKVISDQSVQVPYKGVALESGRKYYWQ